MRKQLTKFLSGVDHRGRRIVASEVLQVLLPRPSRHGGKFLGPTEKDNYEKFASLSCNVMRNIVCYLCAAFSALITFAKIKSANAFPLVNVAP